MQSTISLRRATTRSPFRRAAVTLVSAITALTVFAGPALAYNVYVSSSGTIGSSSSTIACFNDSALKQIRANAPWVNSSNGRAQVVKTRQVFQKYVYDQATRKNLWKDVYVAPIRTHDYPNNTIDIRVDAYNVTTAGYYRVVTDIWWPTGSARALYEHRMLDHYGSAYAFRLDYCGY